MNVNQFRENYPNHQIHTTMRHYQPKNTVKVGWFKTVTYEAECIIEAKIMTEGVTVSTGSCYGQDAGCNGFLSDAEDDAITNAIFNLITEKEAK